MAHAGSLPAGAVAVPSRPAVPGDTFRAPHWELRSNCSLSPRAMLAVMGGLAGVSFAIAGGFWWAGAPFVLPFACLELLALAAALVFYARHAGDGDVIDVAGGRVVVQCQRGNRLQRHDFDAASVQVHCGNAPDDLIELAAPGRTVRLGRHVTHPRRRAVTGEVQRVLLLQRRGFN